jgi:hypothetical protein
MTGPESVRICQSLSWWKIMQTAESLATKGVQRVFLRSCTELSTAHGDSCRGVEEFTHRVLMESRGKRLAWQGHRRCTMSGFALPKARGKSLSGREGVRRITCWQGIGLPNAAGSLFMVANTQGSLSLGRALPARHLMVQFALGSVHSTGAVWH